MKSNSFGDLNVVILSDEVGGGVRHRPLKRLQIENSAKIFLLGAHVLGTGDYDSVIGTGRL
jgi:hypothetical protein